jgi:hypothetical protein
MNGLPNMSASCLGERSPERSRVPQFTTCPGVVEEWREVVVRAVVVADLEDIERAQAVDFAHNGEIDRLQVAREERGIAEPSPLPALHRGIEAVDSPLHAFTDEHEDALVDDPQALGGPLGVFLEMQR